MSCVPKGVHASPTHQRPNPNPNSTSTTRPSSPQENHDEQNQGVVDAPSLKKKWVPKSENGEKTNEATEKEAKVVDGEEQPKKEEEGSVVLSKSSGEGKKKNKNGNLRKKEKKARERRRKVRSQNKATLIASVKNDQSTTRFFTLKEL